MTETKYDKLRAEVRCVEAMLRSARTPAAREKLQLKLTQAKAAAHAELMRQHEGRRAEKAEARAAHQARIERQASEKAARESDVQGTMTPGAARWPEDRALLNLLGDQLGHGVVASYADVIAGRTPRQLPLIYRLKAAWAIVRGAQA